MVVLLAGLVWQGYTSYLATRSIERLELFIDSGLEHIDEASGATFDPDAGIAYVVDDDEPIVFAFELNSAENRYQLAAETPIVDTANQELGNSEVEDLEAIV